MNYKSSMWDILQAMEKYGGGFVKQLAALYQIADPTNKKRLESTFHEYFTKYDDVASHDETVGR